MDSQSQAVSLGWVPEPPSPKCRTSPERALVTEPMGGKLGISIFSSIVPTVWDLPVPSILAIRHCKLENGEKTVP